MRKTDIEQKAAVLCKIVLKKLIQFEEQQLREDSHYSNEPID